MKTVAILRGISGSGKSTLAQEIYCKYGVLRVEESINISINPEASIKLNSNYIKKEEAIFSTDDYFVRPDGEYDFNAKLLMQAHDWNYGRFFVALKKEQLPFVIVDNTNTQYWEMERYLEGVKNCGYHLEIYEPDTPWKFDLDELEKRNTHKVPRKSIERMLNRWEPTIEIAKKIEKDYGVIADVYSGLSEKQEWRT